MNVENWVTDLDYDSGTRSREKAKRQCRASRTNEQFVQSVWIELCQSCRGTKVSARLYPERGQREALTIRHAIRSLFLNLHGQLGLMLQQ